MARGIQERFLPRELPRLPGFSFAATCRMCSHVGGDYYDFIPMGGNRVAVAVGDAAGHGVGSALLMANARACLRSSVESGQTPPPHAGPAQQPAGHRHPSRDVHDHAGGHWSTPTTGRSSTSPPATTCRWCVAATSC